MESKGSKSSIIRNILADQNANPAQKQRFLNEILYTSSSSSNPSVSIKNYINQFKTHITNFDDRIARIHNEIKRITKKSDKEIKKDKLLLKNTMNKYYEKEAELKLMELLLNSYNKNEVSMVSSSSIHTSIDPSLFKNSSNSSRKSSRGPI
jgi:uncharacterized protein YdcH (DUF465 family)